MTLVITNARPASAADVYPGAGASLPPSAHLVVVDGLIAHVLPPDRSLPPGAETLDAGGALAIPGLHDHHVHLLATAAALESVDCGPDRIRIRGSLHRVLAEADAELPDGQWIRGVGLEEAGGLRLDRHALDSAVPSRPVRVQHRSGALWVLNSAALALLPELPHSPDVERDTDGHPTGRLYRLDTLVAAAAGRRAPDLFALGSRLASHGITGTTDATPCLDDSSIRLLADAVGTATLPPSLTLLGSPLEGHDLVSPWGSPPGPGLRAGPWKLHLHDHDLPDFDRLTEWVTGARDAGRPVAVHCVTRESLILTLAAIDAVGPVPGDRIEHASVAPPEVFELIRALGIRVVTQPGFLASRGDFYADHVDPEDLPHLYPFAGLLDAGVAVACSSDAPYTTTNPWAAIRAAVDRRAASGRVLGPRERIFPAEALSGYLSQPHEPGGAARELVPGAPADICLVRPAGPDTDPVVDLTLAAGEVTHRAG